MRVVEVGAWALLAVFTGAFAIVSASQSHWLDVLPSSVAFVGACILAFQHLE